MFIWRNLTPAAIVACLEALAPKDEKPNGTTGVQEEAEDATTAAKARQQQAVIEIQSRL